MKAIMTIYLGPTNTKGSRIKASDMDGNRIIRSIDSSVSVDANHKYAAIELCRKMGWSENLIGGSLKDCMVWVFTD